MKQTADVAIIGGGIIGCAIAYYLRKAGMDVTVLERGEIGAEASSAAAGLLAPLGSLSGPGPLADLLLASWSLFPTLVSELEEASDIALEYERPGALRIVRNSKRIANLHKRMQSWQPLGLEMRWLNSDEARRREPLLTPHVCAAIYAPEEGQIRAAHLVKAFALAAEKRGAKLRGHQEVIAIQRQGNRVSAISTVQGETIACHQLIIASGAWAARWSEQLHMPIPVSPQRGQILSVRQPSPPLRHLLFGEAVYLAPKADNTIVIGATKEEVGFEKQLTTGGVSWLLSTAARLAPVLEHSPIERMWVGLRPKTPDNLPILGNASTWENVILAVGHGSVGIMLSAITGQAISELVTTGQAPQVIRPFVAERFNEYV